MSAVMRWWSALTREPDRPLEPREQWIAVALVLVVYVVTFLVADGLRSEPFKDEVHFYSSSQTLAGPITVESLRSYPEVVTPLALVVWGQLERITGDGLFAGRLLNWLLSMAIVFGLLFAEGGRTRRAAMAAVGLLCFPYFLSLSVHLYTDLPALFLGVAGLHLHTRGRGLAAFLCFALAIATRQYFVLIPAAVAADEFWRALRGEVERWRPGGVAAAAAATLLGWFAFFGGLAPQPGLDYWLPLYPAPMTSAFAFMLDFGVYTLTGLAVWFVIPESLLFPGTMRWRELRTPSMAVWALAVFAVVVALGHVLPASEGGGPFGRAVRMVLPGEAFAHLHTAIFAAMALLTIARFKLRLDLATWLVLACCALNMKSQLPWEKYLLPALGALWYLHSRGSIGSAAAEVDAIEADA